MENGHFKTKKIELKKVHSCPKRRVNYEPSLFGFSEVRGNGKYVRVCVIDSGAPIHKDILVDGFKTKNFTTSGSEKDVYGHSTAVSGIIAANGKSGIKGFAPETDLFFAKVLLDEDGEGDFDSVIDALLWSIVRDVDIIIMSFGSSNEHEGLHDAIKKVYKHGIPMFSACGNCNNRTKDADFPARYDEVFSVGYSNSINCNEVIRVGGKAKGVILPYQDFETTFTDSKFATMNGSSLFTAAVTGIAVLSFQNMRQKGLYAKSPQILYNEVGRLAIKE